MGFYGYEVLRLRGYEVLRLWGYEVLRLWESGDIQGK